METKLDFEEVVKDGIRCVRKIRSTVDGGNTVYSHVYEPIPIDSVEDDVRQLGKKHLALMQDQWRRQDAGTDAVTPEKTELEQLLDANIESIYESCIMDDSQRSILAEAYGKEHIRKLYLEGALS